MTVIRAALLTHRRATWLGLSGVLVGLVALSFAAGYRYRGHDQEQEDATKFALNQNAQRLKVATVHRDSTKKEAAAAVTASDTHRDTSRATITAVGITSDTTLQIGDLPPVVMPKLGVDAYRDLLEGRGRDSVTIVSLKADVAALEAGESLWVQRDSLHLRREQHLELEAKAEGKRGFWRGVKTGVVGTVVAIATLVIVK